MRYVMLTYVHPDDAKAYYALSPEEHRPTSSGTSPGSRRRTDRRWRGARRAGEGEDPAARSAGGGDRHHRRSVHRDQGDPGGFIVLETDTVEEALAIATGWPSLTSQPNATVQLQPVFVRD